MIGIISAMPEEMQSVLDAMQVSETISKGKREYHKGVLFGKEVVLVFSRWGKVASATTVTQLLNLFEVSEIIFSGVAGALQTDLNIGDVVIGKQLIQHDMNASPLYKTLEIPLLDITAFETAESKKIEQAVSQFLDNYSNFFNDEPQEFGIDSPKLQIGTIVSGDQFVNSGTKIEALLKLVPEALCTEMEGAAVAQVCYEYDIPFQIIRIISDKADDNSHIDFPLFAKEVAGKYALGILHYYFSNSDLKRKLKEV